MCIRDRGIYPVRMPVYDTAFIFVEGQYEEAVSYTHLMAERLVLLVLCRAGWSNADQYSHAGWV